MPAKDQRMSDEHRRKISAALTRKELPNEKRCPNCATTKPADEFRRRRTGSGFVLASYCKPCEQAKAKADWQAKRKPRLTPMQRFMAMVDKQESGCWLFTGGAKPNGYANFKVRSHTTVHAHRWSYEQHVGAVPEGLQLDHLCRVRNCVNPDHLEPVTAMENLHRSSRWPKRADREARILAWLASNSDSAAADVATALSDSTASIRAVLNRLEKAGQVTSRRPTPRRRVYSRADPTRSASRAGGQ